MAVNARLLVDTSGWSKKDIDSLSGLANADYYKNFW
jgi:hypothetical protein